MIWTPNMERARSVRVEIVAKISPKCLIKRHLIVTEMSITGKWLYSRTIRSVKIKEFLNS